MLRTLSRKGTAVYLRRGAGVGPYGPVGEGAVLKIGTGPIDEVNGGRPKFEANSLDYPLFKLEKQ